MVVDQHFSRGVDVVFFGRTCKANPSIARLARRFDCPVVGVRVIREPGHRFRIEGFGPYELPRGDDGEGGCRCRDSDVYECHRGVGARISRSVSVVSSPLAIGCVLTSPLATGFVLSSPLAIGVLVCRF